ncbi:MAG: hypothetical protein ACP5OG_02270 [Candidatus Nanoarchaeia archaeon]
MRYITQDSLNENVVTGVLSSINAIFPEYRIITNGVDGPGATSRKEIISYNTQFTIITQEAEIILVASLPILPDSIGHKVTVLLKNKKVVCVEDVDLKRRYGFLE